MCTNITQTAPVQGSAKGPAGWFRVDGACVGYDHPVHAAFDHALTLDFRDEASGRRVGIELSRASAQGLVDAIRAVLAQAEEYEDGPVEPGVRPAR